MSKVIKLKEAQVKEIVNKIVQEHLGEYQPTMADAQIEEDPIDGVEEQPMDEPMDEPEQKPETGEKFGVAIGPDGRHYVMSYETGEIIGAK